ncbi:MAG: glycosyltransferase family 39 protein [Sterolibacterium sp.]|jgi:4-amino-4-deoxy-L-arabinose transferase-like glycosyltransferase|nr:glycosyltransferase family 39 protein [Sterolibacterium sp.]
MTALPDLVEYFRKCWAGFLQAHELPLRWLGYAAITLLAYTRFFVGIGDYGIINGNESLYVESAREMALSGDWAIPTLNGLPYLEKPPLLIWLITLSQFLLGAGEAQARLVTAMSAFVLVLALIRYSVLLGIGRRGFAAAFILVTSLGMDLMSRVAMPDMLLTALFACACFSTLVALIRHSTAHARLGAACLGLSALIKGPLSIALFALILTGMYLSEPSQRAWMRVQWRDRQAWLWLLLPLTLWLLAIERQQAGTIYYFIVNEHILRFLGLREPHDYYSGSVFYYLPRLFMFIFPWAGVFFFGWLAARRKVEPERRPIRRFLGLCVWIPLVFFSVSSAKANYYIILCVPAIALLTAEYLPALTERRHRMYLALSVAVPILLLIVLGLLILGFIQAGWRRAAALCVGGLIVPISFQFDHLVARAEPIMSARTLAAYIQQHASTTPVYLRRNLPVIDCDSNDLYYGRHQRPHDANLISSTQVLARGSGSLIVVMNEREDDYRQTRLGRQSTELTKIGRTTLFQLDAAGTAN